MIRQTSFIILFFAILLIIASAQQPAAKIYQYDTCLIELKQRHVTGC